MFDRLKFNKKIIEKIEEVLLSRWAETVGYIIIGLSIIFVIATIVRFLFF
jgi:hypothetical protein